MRAYTLTEGELQDGLPLHFFLCEDGLERSEVPGQSIDRVSVARFGPELWLTAERDDARERGRAVVLYSPPRSLTLLTPDWERADAKPLIRGDNWERLGIILLRPGAELRFRSGRSLRLPNVVYRWDGEKLEWSEEATPQSREPLDYL